MRTLVSMPSGSGASVLCWEVVILELAFCSAFVFVIAGMPNYTFSSLPAVFMLTAGFADCDTVTDCFPEGIARTIVKVALSITLVRLECDLCFLYS